MHATKQCSIPAHITAGALRAQVLAEAEAARCGASLLITGYVASLESGAMTTLGRDGSDYSASIFGRLLDAEAVVIWTDVGGVLTADPRRVPEAQVPPLDGIMLLLPGYLRAGLICLEVNPFLVPLLFGMTPFTDAPLLQVLDEVSYNEAIELAYFGAKVIHPKTMNPVMHAGIPVFIRNTFDFKGRGTRIHATSDLTKYRKSCVAGFTTIDNMALLNVEGTGMIGVSGITERIFSVLSSMHMTVQLIAQASSEHSLCFAIKSADRARTEAALNATFAREMAEGHVNAITVIEPCSIVAVVGDGMSSTPGVAGRIFSSISKAHINIVAIAQVVMVLLSPFNQQFSLIPSAPSKSLIQAPTSYSI